MEFDSDDDCEPSPKAPEHVGEASTYMPLCQAAPAGEYLPWCRKLAEEDKFQRYEQTGPGYSFMKVGPKIEWYLRDDQGRRAKYGWGQTPRFWQAGYPMELEPLVMKLATYIEKTYDEKVNHAILKWYADGVEQNSPPHQDKAPGVKGATPDKCDMAENASFYIFSFHDKSSFEFYLQRGRGVPPPTGKEVELKSSDIVWRKALESGSLLKVSALDNRTYFHALHKKKGASERFSLIFRVITTFIPIDAACAAEVNSDRYRFVSKAQAKAGKAKPSQAELEAAAEDDAKAAAARAAEAGEPWAEIRRRSHNRAARAAAMDQAELVD
jgi:hypothetical protein